MPEGEQGQNLNQQDPGAGNGQAPGPFDSQSPLGSAPQGNSGVDGISGAGAPIEEISLGPNQISPNLAKGGDYFPDQNRPGPVGGPTSQEMQYPSYNESEESSFNLKLILIIIGVVVLLGGATTGIVLFLNSRNATPQEEVVPVTDPGSSSGNGDTSGQSGDTTSSSGDSTTDTGTSDQTQNTPAVTPPPTPAPVAQPKIETPQPAEKTPDATGAVEGSG